MRACEQNYVVARNSEASNAAPPARAPQPPPAPPGTHRGEQQSRPYNTL